MMSGNAGGWGVPKLGGPLALLIIAGVALYGFSRRNGGADGPTPRAVLDHRYAKGEITREQFELMKRDLAT